jgi:hypothetical protein
MASCKCSDKYDALFTETQLKELLATGGKLEGFWSLTIHAPEDAKPFTTDKSWLDLVNQLVEQAGVSITKLEFRTQPHLLGYEYGLKED